MTARGKAILFIVAAGAMFLIPVIGARAATPTQRAGWNIIKQAGLDYGVPLHLGTLAHARCDDEVQVLPFKTTCATPIGYPGKAICYSTINMDASGHSKGRILCGSQTRGWNWGALYTYNGKSFTFSGQSHVGHVPWKS